MGFGGPMSKMQLTRAPSVEAAIENGQVYVDLQPVVELATGHIHGYEALARCKLPALATPMLLFATAIEQGVLPQLAREVRRRSVIAANGATLFLNVHPAEVELASADDPIAAHAGTVVLDVQEAPPDLDELRARGIALALDGLGVGCSSLGAIAALDPDLVKLDRELIAGVRMHSRRHELLAALAALCTTWGATVVAEGVETRDELLAVMTAGIPLAQGYYLGRPSLTGASTWTPS